MRENSTVTTETTVDNDKIVVQLYIHIHYVCVITDLQCSCMYWHIMINRTSRQLNKARQHNATHPRNSFVADSGRIRTHGTLLSK